MKKSLLIFLGLSSLIFADTTFKSTQPVKNLMVGVVSSDITVTGYEGTTVEITHNLGEKLTFKEENGTLSGEVHDTAMKMLTGLFKKAEPTYVNIKAPKDLLLVIGTASGNLTVKDMNGNVTSASASGNATLNNLGGNAEVTTVSGTTKVDGVKGIFIYSGTSGNLNFNNIENLISVTSTSGNITGTIKNASNSKVFAVSGDVSLTLTQGGSYTFHAKAKSGKLSITSPLLKITSTGSEVTGTVGTPTKESLKVETAFGDITVR